MCVHTLAQALISHRNGAAEATGDLACLSMETEGWRRRPGEAQWGGLAECGVLASLLREV